MYLVLIHNNQSKVNSYPHIPKSRLFSSITVAFVITGTFCLYKRFCYHHQVVNVKRIIDSVV